MNRAASNPFRAVVVVPTYNNAATLSDVLAGALGAGLPVIAVNDGSTDDTAEILKRWTAGAGEDRQLLTHPINRGKAAALQSGFDAARDRGFTHALTIDSDGQLDTSDIPALIAAAAASPESFVLGMRDDRQSSYPIKSRVGRRVSNFLVRLESGARVQDSQCGLRVYPLDLVAQIKCRASRFAFETEVLTRAAWAGCEYIEIPVRCSYPDPAQRISHFRPWVDSWRSVATHLPLVARALAPWPHRRWPRLPALPRRSFRARIRALIQSFNPAAAYRELRRDEVAGPAMAVALGLGVWIANLPVYGFQTLLGIYAARRLHLNTLAVVLGTQLSTPPIGPILIVAAIALGHLILHGKLLVLANFDLGVGWGKVIGPILLDWFVGGTILGLVLGILTYFISMALFQIGKTEDGAPVLPARPD